MESVLGTLQSEVQRKVGYCVLLLQQYESLLKAVMTAFSITLEGRIEEFEVARQEQITNTRKKTLGTLVKEFIGDHLTDDEAMAGASKAGIGTEALGVRVRFGIQMQPESLAQVESDLEALVLLRNELIHHLVESFDIFSEGGCGAAIAHLDICHETIEKNLGRLRHWTRSFEEARAMMVSAMGTEEFENVYMTFASPKK